MRITYDTDVAPKRGNFLVSVGSKGIGSIYHILSVRKVRSKVQNRYSLKVLAANDMRKDAVLIEGEVLIRGKKEFPLYWYSRNSKANEHT